jgi:hypothetical protein
MLQNEVSEAPVPAEVTSSFAEWISSDPQSGMLVLSGPREHAADYVLELAVRALVPSRVLEIEGSMETESALHKFWHEVNLVLGAARYEAEPWLLCISLSRESKWMLPYLETLQGELQTSGLAVGLILLLDEGDRLPAGMMRTVGGFIEHGPTSGEATAQFDGVLSNEQALLLTLAQRFSAGLA